MALVKLRKITGNPQESHRCSAVTVPVKVVWVAPKPVLESVEDVNDYLNTLRMSLMQGQYLHYRMALNHLGIHRTPYLALPEAIYTNYLSQPFFQDSLSLHHVNLFTINIVRQEIVRWNPTPLLP